MSSTTKENSAESVVINKILFDTMYKKRIMLFDWFYTKAGAGSLLLLISIGIFGDIQIMHIVGWFAFAFFMVQRSTILAHTKDRELWGKVFIYDLFEKIQSTKPSREKLETAEIIEACKAEVPRRTKPRQRKRRKKI
jgi:hypothetical protein